MNVPHEFRTKRLRLRIPEVSDASAIFEEYANDAEVTRFLVWTPHLSEESTRAFLVECRENWKRRTEYTWTIAEATRAIGMISARRSAYTVELGYVLAKRHWGRGLVPEAARTIMDWWFTQPSVRRVQAYCDVENTASARVLEKIGMHRETLMPRHAIHPNVSQEARDCFLYAKNRESNS